MKKKVKEEVVLLTFFVIGAGITLITISIATPILLNMTIIPIPYDYTLKQVLIGWFISGTILLTLAIITMMKMK